MALHPQAAAVLKAARAANLPGYHVLSPAEARAIMNAGVAAAPFEIEPVLRVENRAIPGPAGDIPVRIYTPSEGDKHPLIMLFHGGGWVLGNLENEDTTCRGLARRTDSVVVSVDYRLAPETRFPGAVDDCYAATAWAVEHAAELGADGSRVAVSGTSAGGNLSAAVSLMARDRGGPNICHQVLFTPVTDHDFDVSSYIDNAEGFGLTRAAMIWFWDHYVPDVSERNNPYASPARADDLSGLPAATIITAEYDPLRDEAEVFGDRLSAAGVDVQCTRYDGMVHGFNNKIGIYDNAKDALDQAAARLNASFGA